MHRSRLRIISRFVVVAIFTAVLVPATDHSVRAQEDRGASSLFLATIAQGVTPLPAEPVAWRVVRDTAEARGQANFEVRALGFALATEDPIVQTDEANGERLRLDPLEASFNREAASHRRESATDAPVPYLRLQLVPEIQASEGGGDELIFTGDAFPAPAGDHDVSLALGWLDGDAVLDLDAAAPVLILVVDGDLEVSADGGAGETVTAGEAASFDGNLDLDAGDGAIIAVAAIGPAVDEDAGEPIAVEVGEPIADDAGGQTDSAGTVTVLVGVGGCPAGTDLSGRVPGAAGAACVDAAGTPLLDQALLAGVTVVLVNLDTGAEFIAVTGADGWASFPDVPSGIYQASVRDVFAALMHCRFQIAPNTPPQDLGDMSPRRSRSSRPAGPSAAPSTSSSLPRPPRPAPTRLRRRPPTPTTPMATA